MCQDLSAPFAGLAEGNHYQKPCVGAISVITVAVAADQQIQATFTTIAIVCFRTDDRSYSVATEGLVISTTTVKEFAATNY